MAETKGKLTRMISIFPEKIRKAPELWMEIYIAGSAYEERQFAEMLVRSRCTKALSPESADLVIFTGGGDVNPVLYGEEPHPETKFCPERDAQDIKLYKLCLEEGIPMLGICRGAQFLHVMNGGKLIQHLDEHYGDHHVWDKKNRIALTSVSSVHHQAVLKHDGIEVIAETSRSKTRWLNDKEKDVSLGYRDIEAFFYRDTCCLGIQGHPEYRGYPDFTLWSLKLIEDYISFNPDIVIVEKMRRINPDIRMQREKAETLQ